MKETKFKDTDLGSIPEDWEIHKVEEFSDVVTGATPSTENSDYWGGHILWMNSGELNNKVIYDVIGRITKEGYNSTSTHILPIDSVLVGLAGQGKTRGTVAINKIPLCTNQSIGAILPSEQYDPDYLYFFMDSQYENLRSISSGDGGRGGLTKKLLLNFEIVGPKNTKEQKFIAEVLSDTDALIKELDVLIEKKRAILQGTMQELLTAHRRLPGFSEPWKEIPLGEYTTITMGQSPDSIYYNLIGDGLPLIQGNADIKNFQSIIRYYSSIYTKVCEPGDIIMSVRAPVGAVGIASFKSCLGRGVCSFSKDKFLFFVLRFREKIWEELSAGSTFDSVNTSQISNFKINIPSSIEEKDAIAEILSDIDSEISELEAKRDKYIAIRQGMMQQLLTGKIRLI